jgi:hypothetical protein
LGFYTPFLICKNMKSLYVDANSRSVQVARLSMGLNVSAAGVVEQITPNQFIRVKATGGDAVIRLENQPGDGVVISEGETEYFYIDSKLELVSGSINVMY